MNRWDPMGLDSVEVDSGGMAWWIVSREGLFGREVARYRLGKARDGLVYFGESWGAQWSAASLSSLEQLAGTFEDLPADTNPLKSRLTSERFTAVVAAIQQKYRDSINMPEPKTFFESWIFDTPKWEGRLYDIRHAQDGTMASKRAQEAFVDTVGDGVFLYAGGKFIGGLLETHTARVVNVWTRQQMGHKTRRALRGAKDYVASKVDDAWRWISRSGAPQPSPASLTPSSSVWEKAPIDRGVAIERHLAQGEYADWFNVGAANRGKFPLIDFQKGNNLVSLKTVDTAGKSWMRRLQSHIRELAARGATVDGKAANMVLDLRVQPGGARAAESLIDFGRSQGVTVIVKEFP